MLQTAFTNQGAVPQKPMLPGLGGDAAPSTPAAAALMGASLPKPTIVPNAPQQQQSPTFMGGQLSLGNNAGLLGSVKPSTPVKKITQGSDGSQTVEYHTPQKPAVPQPTYDAQGNAIIPKSQETTTPANPPSAPAGTPPPAGTSNGVLPPQNQTAPSFPSTVSGVIGASEQAPAIGQEAANIAANYGKRIAEAGQQGALAQEGLMTTGGPSGPIVGNALAQAQLAAAREQALGTAESAALQGTGQQLTAQQQEQAGLSSAAGLIAPTGTFPFVFNPATGQFTTPGGTSGTAVGAPTLTYNPQNDANTLAKAVIGLKIPYSDALNAMGYAGNVGTGLLQTAITAQGGDLTKIEAQQAAIQSNVQTAGTAGVQAANTAYNAAVQNVSNATKQYSAATGVANNLASTLASWQQSGQLTNVNSAINKIAGLTSSPQYAQFNAALLNAQSAFTAAFASAGITPTQSTANALNELNGDSSAKAIVSALNQLSSDLHAATVVPAYQQQSTYAKQLGIQ